MNEIPYARTLAYVVYASRRKRALSPPPPNMVVTKGGWHTGCVRRQLRSYALVRVAGRERDLRGQQDIPHAAAKKNGARHKKRYTDPRARGPTKRRREKTLIIQVKIFVAEARNTKISQSQISFSRIFVWEDTLVDRKYRGRGSGGKHRSFFWQWDGLDIMRSFKWKVTGWIIPYREKKLVAVCINVMHIRLLLSFLPGG